MTQEAARTLRELLDSLQPYPEMRLLLFSEGWGAPEEALLDFAEREGHSILLYQLRKELEEELPSSVHLSHRPYRKEQPRYNLQGRLYNHVFVFGKVPDEPEAFLRKVYTGITNAGGFYLLENEAAKDRLRHWEQSLNASNYVAVNPIDLDGKSTLLTARKMHGWGG